MDRLRVALGVQRIDYYGMSYGTALGSVYAQLFPSHVGAMVFDGAVDANLSLISDAKADAVSGWTDAWLPDKAPTGATSATR